MSRAPDFGFPRASQPGDRQPRRSRTAGSPAIVPQWELDDAVTVVLFAGLGGACQGLEEAGCPVNVANNHDAVALAAHAALHPHTKHIKGDIFDVDPLVATDGRRVKVLWGSPDCRDHSVAKGGAPRSARVRSLPWQLCRWAGKTKPVVVFVENVREIRGWGPLIAKRDPVTGRVVKMDGSVAAKGERVPLFEQQLVRDKARAGRSFRRWRAHMRGLGYAYDDRDLNCADYGVPTARRRFFAVMRRDGRPIAWPERTHAPRAIAESLGLLPWVPAWKIIDWSLPLPSIFERKKSLAEATHRRIAAGLKRYVLESASPFLVPITHTGGVRVHGIDEPLRTVTTAHRGEIALVAPTIIGTDMTSTRACRAFPLQDPLRTIHTRGGFGVVGASLIQTGYGEAPGQAPRALDIEAPLGTVVAGGSKHALVGAWMAQHNLGVTGHAMTEPLSTLTTAGTQQQLGAAYLAKLRGTSTAADAEAPVPTLSAGGNHVAAVAAFLTKYYGTGGQDQAADDALHTLSTKARFGVVTVTIAGESYAVSDIGMRMLEPHEAAAAHELVLPKQITIDGHTRKLTKTESMRLIGNSVPKRMARLLAQANSANALYVPAGDKLAAD
jgi:DNA (cytosine-5)-methyltransferase 1